MIALLMGAALAAAPEVLEAPVAGETTVVAQAVFPAEGLGRRDGAALRALAHAMLRRTEELSGPALLRYGSQAGRPPQIEVGPGFLRVTVEAPAGAMDVAAHLLESIVQRPSLGDDDVREAIAEARVERHGWLRQALEPVSYDWSRVRPSGVREVHRRILRPQRMVLVAAGALRPGDAAELGRRFAGWRPPPALRPVADPPPIPRTRVEGGASVAEFRAGPIAPHEATRLMAVVALGTGKDASLWRVLRAARRETYFQQAVLWPTPGGWQARLMWARRGEVDFDAIRAALLADVGTWTEEDAQRARAMTRACLERGLAISPFMVGADHWLGADSRGAADWAGLVSLMGAPGLSRETLVAALANVDAEGLREAATAILESANASLLPSEP